MKVKVTVLIADGAPLLQVEEEMEELRDIYRRRPEEEEDEESEAGSNNIRTTTSSRSPVKKKKQVDAYWQQTQQRILTAQQLGNHYVHTVATVTRLSGIRALD